MFVLLLMGGAEDSHSECTLRNEHFKCFESTCVGLWCSSSQIRTPIFDTFPGGAAARPFVSYHRGLATKLYLRTTSERYHKVKLHFPQPALIMMEECYCEIVSSFSIRNAFSVFCSINVFTAFLSSLRQMAVIGGMPKVHEIGREFRNEAIDMNHHPEYTTCRFFMAFKDYFDLMGLTEEMLSGQWKCVSSVALTSFTLYRLDQLELYLI